MEMGLDEVRMKGIGTKHDISSSKQKFESDDSQGSDLSYESSLTDEEDNNIGRIQFFKEEMARFFINYPELINKNIIQDADEENPDSQEESQVNRDRLNRNWQSIAEEILNQAKQSSTSLESLAKRISLYRYKIDQSDIIDLILQEKNSILKEIDAQIAQKKNEANLIDQNQKHEKNAEKRYRQDNSYYSWRKRKQYQSKLARAASIKRPSSQNHSQQRKQNDKSEEKTTKITQKFTRSLQKTGKVNDNKNIEKAPAQKGKRQSNFPAHADHEEAKNMDESQVTQGHGSRLNSNWKHLINFQPKTEIGRQLSQEIKKNNCPSDELGIKKTIINFLIRYKEMINNEIINKITLSQKIQKLYNDDAKELLMFYPSKINNFDNTANASNGHFKDAPEDKFMKLLREINDGPLMKYWRQLQQNKI